MTDVAQLDKAIGAHGMWKTRLKQAISNGAIDTTVDKICKDNECEFGKWLYSDGISATEKGGQHYIEVKKLHAEFHKVAGKVADLAVKGKKTEAEGMLSLTGEFGVASTKLTSAVMAWKKAL